MKTLDDPAVLASLVARLSALTPERERRWGTLTPHEMLCHLADAGDMALRRHARPASIRRRTRLVFKGLLLWTPVRWPHGVKTNPKHDPRAQGTKPTAFEADLARAVAVLRELAAAGADAFEPLHGIFGTMSRRDWQRWAYKHTDYHLRQFGL